MGLLDTLLGRTKQAQPNLDQLFGLSSAALTLEAAGDFRPTGYGAVSYRKVEGGAFAQVEADVEQLLEGIDGPQIEVSKDQYGYTWLRCRREPENITDLVTDLHAVNSSLQDNGFGPYLLCSLVSFVNSSGRKMALVYLYKRGTFYPFVPINEPKRDNVTEFQIKSQVANDLRLEPDTARWFPVWGAPGM